MKIIIISGTPGTGKTILAKFLSKNLNFEYINTSRLINHYSLSDEYDSKKKCWVVDISVLLSFLFDLIEFFKKKKAAGIIVDSHLSHYIPSNMVDTCIITKCSLKELKKRLIKRGYSSEKIRENLDCEIFDVCLTEAQEAGHKILIANS